MSMETSPASPPPALTPQERRVLGVLVEKQKTTPEYYPMTVAAIVTGSNQKSNRDPVVNYEAEDVEDTLDGLRRRGAVLMVEGVGRTTKWKHNLYEWLDLKGKAVEMAVVAELLLRGPQTEGDLRARASRMDAIADLPTLQTILQGLANRGLVVFLTPAGQRRGVVVTHGLYPPGEFERVRAAHAHGPAESVPEAVSPAMRRGDEIESLRAELSELRGRVEELEREIGSLRDALGA